MISMRDDQFLYKSYLYILIIKIEDIFQVRLL